MPDLVKCSSMLPEKAPPGLVLRRWSATAPMLQSAQQLSPMPCQSTTGSCDVLPLVAAGLHFCCASRYGLFMALMP